MSRKYNDHYDDPTWDPEDEAFGDYDELLFGFHEEGPTEDEYDDDGDL
jgi:hypothetical protein